MSLQIKNRKDCVYDLISMGEVMLRMDPGNGRIRCAHHFDVWEGGGEYNVARGLSRCFGMKTGIVTALAENEVGYLIENLILQGGTDSSFIQWVPYDGIGRRVRNGLNFTERGFGIRAALGVSDRANTAASQMKPRDVDWDHIFGDLGVRWFHTGGIFAALSESTAELVIEALQAAKKYGTVVSYDLNYRPSLWNGIGGIEKAQEINRRIAPFVDVMIGNEEDFTACLGFKIEDNDAHYSKLNLEGYTRMIREVSAVYPNMKVIATTLREAKTASINGWSAICWCRGKLYKAKDYNDLEIFDRVGGGDSFASGLIYGFLQDMGPEMAVNIGAAHGALAMTTPGDTSMARKKEVMSLVEGKGFRVQR